MIAEPLHFRRARRTDLIALLGIMTASGLMTPPPDRAMLRRFRRLVSDLGSDLYVALLSERIVGFVHITYARQIVTASHARIETLVVDPPARRKGVGSRLLALAIERARRRDCFDLNVPALAEAAIMERMLSRHAGCVTTPPFIIRISAPPLPG